MAPSGGRMRTDQPLFVLLAATVVIGAVTAWSGGAQRWQPLPENRRTYYNHEFGFSLEIPFAAPACDPLDNNQDTGITFFLDEGSSDCNLDWSERRFVSFIEEYNAPGYASAADILRSCPGEVSPTDARLFPAALPLMPMMCRELRGDLVSYRLAGVGAGGSLIHNAYFQTLARGITDVRYGEVFTRDLAIFRATLTSMHRYEPDPDDVRGTGFAAILSRELRQPR